jgi:hypothetical protein
MSEFFYGVSLRSNPLVMKYGPVIIIIISLSACSSVKFHRDRLLKMQNNGYQIFVDYKVVNLDTFYINPEDVSFDSRNLTKLYFKSKRPFIFIGMDATYQNFDYLEGDYLLIIDGVPVIDSLKSKIKFEGNFINKITILKSQDSLRGTHLFRSPTLIIKSKKSE